MTHDDAVAQMSAREAAEYAGLHPDAGNEEVECRPLDSDPYLRESVQVGAALSLDELEVPTLGPLPDGTPGGIEQFDGGTGNTR